MRGLILAIQFLTRLPTPQVRDFQPGELARAAGWFPLVGLLVGAAVASGVWLGARVDPWLGALLGLLVWVWISGALHLDGLCDLADALGAMHSETGGNRERLFEVLRDPHVGSFGAVALGLQLLSKLVLLMLAAQFALFWPLLLVPAWARLGTLVWARLPPIKPGLGASLGPDPAQPERFAWQTPTWALLLWGALLLPACVAYPGLLAAPVLILVWRAFLLRRLGGMTGDALGAGVEWLESGLLLVLVLGFTMPALF
jgi:adenosylcobinamide-GDP ribazoletransferase